MILLHNAAQGQEIPCLDIPKHSQELIWKIQKTENATLFTGHRKE